jgi:hypothetical protein
MALLEVPYPDDDVGVLAHQLRHRLQVVERGGEIGVHEQAVPAAGGAHAQPDIAPLARGLAGVEDVVGVEGVGLGARQLGRAVVATSHDDDDFHGAEIVRVRS